MSAAREPFLRRAARPAVRVSRHAGAIVALAIAFCTLIAVPAGGAGLTALPSGVAVPVPPPTLRPARPYWIELTLAQREALAPLGDDWERLDMQTKKKWVEIANRYPKMKTEERQHAQDRMREWAMLTPDQRRIARDSFARVRAMPPEQRAEMLRKYQELPEEKKKQLASEGQTSKLLVLPKPQPIGVTPPRRTQLTEGTKVKNPAIAAQKSASPATQPAKKAVAPAAAAPLAPAPIAPSPAATGAEAPKPAP